MNVRFIILKASESISEEIVYGRKRDAASRKYYGEEFSTYKQAELKLNQIRKKFPHFNYRLAAVWD